MRAMKERPILFSGAMVHAILTSTKTQTRRVVKWRSLASGLNLNFSGLRAVKAPGGWVLESDTRTSSEWRCDPTPCPHGQPGGHLWVRETFYAWGRWETRFSAKKGRDEWHFIDMTQECGKSFKYAAGGWTPGALGSRRKTSSTPAWWRRPAIFMPRAASRIMLEITDVRIQRLQSISESDAKAEGIEYSERFKGYCIGMAEHFNSHDPRQSYLSLWEAINGAGSVEANPWVWVVECRPVAADGVYP